MRGIRTRLAVALVALVAITVAAIGLGTYAFVDARLREGLLADATRQVQFNLSVLVPERLPAGPSRPALDRDGRSLAEAFRLRGDVETIVDFRDGGPPWVSSLGLFRALDAIPQSVRDIVAGGHLGYAWLTLNGEPSVVIGGPTESGPALYFVFPALTVEAALDQLRAGLAVAALVAVVLALLTARLMARGILQPIASGSLAASRIASGDLSARVPQERGSDEFARWAAEFNRMAASLESTVARLEESEARNRRFVADVSHELRTPLTALVAEAALIESDLGSLPPDARRAAELLAGDVRRLRVLVDDLMEVSRFDARAEELRVEPVDLGRTLGAIVDARLPQAVLHLPPSPVVVDSDVRRLDRIVGNLLDNARMHAADSRVDVSLRMVEGTAEVEVADRGPGVAPAALPHLFDRFFKADPSRGSGSTGLGLAIAAEHARLLGGSLAVAPRDGGGLVFTLRLPVTGSLPQGDAADTASGEPLPEVGRRRRAAPEARGAR